MTDGAPSGSRTDPAAPATQHPAGPAAGPPARPETVESFSVVVPAYDEAPNMPELFAELAPVLREAGATGELIVVDDGSTDGTLEAARDAARDAGLEDRTLLLRHRHNRGKTEALVTAARQARGQVLVLFDADLQHAPKEIPRFLRELEQGYDVVTGRKVGRYRKRLVSSIYNWLCRRIFGVPVHDLNAMKAFRRDVLEEIHLRHDWHRYLVVLAHARGFRVSEIDIELHPRRHGESKFTGQWRILVGMLDLLAVWFQLLFSRKPMLFFGITGLGLFLTGGVVGAVALYMRFVLMEGYRPLLNLVLLLVVVGLLLFVVGFLAELIAGLRSEIEELRRDLRR